LLAAANNFPLPVVGVYVIKLSTAPVIPVTWSELPRRTVILSDSGNQFTSFMALSTGISAKLSRVSHPLVGGGKADDVEGT
jgi:hypothetical protein